MIHEILQVQDEAAGLVVSLLDPQPGEKVLDACAAPGGKALFIAARMKNEVQFELKIRTSNQSQQQHDLVQFWQNLQMQDDYGHLTSFLENLLKKFSGSDCSMQSVKDFHILDKI